MNDTKKKITTTQISIDTPFKQSTCKLKKSTPTVKRLTIYMYTKITYKQGKRNTMYVRMAAYISDNGKLLRNNIATSKNEMNNSNKNDTNID